MQDMVRLEALEVLDAIDRYGSFAGAAAALYRVPSAISYTINQLESELGIEVFDRSGHRAVLTPAGRLLLDEGRRILVATRELADAARRRANDWEPELRIAVDGLIPPSSLAAAVAAFDDAHPAINLRLREEVLTGTWEALIDEQVELAIGVAAPPSAAHLHKKIHARVDFTFCCAPSHPLADQAVPLVEDDCRHWRGIVVADSARRFSARSSAGLLDGQPKLTVSSMHAKLDALRRGLGVGYCPHAWVAGDLAAGHLVAPAMARPRPPVQTYLLWRRGGEGRALRWIINHLAATADHAPA